LTVKKSALDSEAESLNRRREMVSLAQYRVLYNRKD